MPRMAAALLLLLATPATASGPPLRSGEFVPLAARAGPLACPQSLTTQQGLGHCVGIRPLGAALVNASAGGADIFVQCKAQAKAPQGSSFTYRYPFLRAEQGVPVFGAPLIIPPPTAAAGRSLAGLDERGPEDPLTNLVVWGSATGGGVYGATFSSDYMHLLRLEGGSRWVHVNSTHFVSPTHTAGFKWGALSSVAVLPGAEAGGWRVFGVLPAGPSARAQAHDLPHSTWRSETYQPYAG